MSESEGMPDQPLESGRIPVVSLSYKPGAFQNAVDEYRTVPYELPKTETTASSYRYSNSDLTTDSYRYTKSDLTSVSEQSAIGYNTGSFNRIRSLAMRSPTTISDVSSYQSSLEVSNYKGEDIKVEAGIDFLSAVNQEMISCKTLVGQTSDIDSAIYYSSPSEVQELGEGKAMLTVPVEVVPEATLRRVQSVGSLQDLLKRNHEEGEHMYPPSTSSSKYSVSDFSDLSQDGDEGRVDPLEAYFEERMTYTEYMPPRVDVTTVRPRGTRANSLPVLGNITEMNSYIARTNLIPDGVIGTPRLRSSSMSSPRLLQDVFTGSALPENILNMLGGN